MKQIYYSMACTINGFDNPIGDGLCCLECPRMQRATEPGKVCQYEKVLSEHVREV